MSVRLDPDLDETARLLLMEDPSLALGNLAARIQAVRGGLPTAAEMGEIWGRYRGWDGRSRPTHDVETGERLR